MTRWLSRLVVPLLLVACSGPGAPAAYEGVVSIHMSPPALTPGFSPSIHDYTVRCAAGLNPVTVTVTDQSGTHTTSLDLVENQELKVGDYWIRCVPHDFPHFAVTKHPGAGDPTPGYYLVNSATFAVVLDDNGVPVWYERGTNVVDVESPAPDTISFVPNSQPPYGWDPATTFDIHMLDDHKTVELSPVGAPNDLHEHLPLANGDYLVTAYPIVHHVDLTGLGSYGPDNDVADCQVQEIDRQGKLVWSWSASDHIDPVKESLEPQQNTINGSTVVDPYHINSIDVDGGGNLLLSFRHTNSVDYVDRTTGKILWKLGGTPYNKDGATHVNVVSDPETTFNMQHDARFLPNGDISLFDDHGADGGKSNEVARGVEYAIDHDANTASLVFQFLGSGESLWTGSFRRYPDGHSVIGWGDVPNDARIGTEVDAAGHDVLDITSDAGSSYRTLKVPLSQFDITVLRATAGK
jgi:Arylsulfotransferase (ASST)